MSTSPAPDPGALPDHMRAAVFERYGPAEQAFDVREIAVPEVGPDQILVQVRCATVTAGDAEIRRLDLPWLFQVPIRAWMGWSRPCAGTVLGMEVAGVVVRVGEGVDGYAIGDAVLGTMGMHFGGNAEYALVDVGPEGLCAHKPEAVSFADAAALPIGALAALGYLKAGGVSAGARVLIRGASGSIGSYAVQLARSFGAHVTGVCGPEGLDRVSKLGAQEVVDYTQTDFRDGGERFDLVLDVVGGLPLSQCLGVVVPGGAYVRATVPGLWETLVALFTNLAGRKRIVMGDAGGNSADLAGLVEQVAEGTVTTVIDRRWSLAEIGDAHAYVDTGHKQGNVLVDV